LTNQRNAEREAQEREAKRLAEQEAYYARYPNQRPKPRTKGGRLYDKNGIPY
jgi:hypothetical protein